MFRETKKVENPCDRNITQDDYDDEDEKEETD
jgi:hypothetical protein